MLYNHLEYSHASVAPQELCPLSFRAVGLFNRSKDVWWKWLIHKGGLGVGGAYKWSQFCPVRGGRKCINVKQLNSLFFFLQLALEMCTVVTPSEWQHIALYTQSHIYYIAWNWSRNVLSHGCIPSACTKLNFLCKIWPSYTFQIIRSLRWSLLLAGQNATLFVGEHG